MAIAVECLLELRVPNGFSCPTGKRMRICREGSQNQVVVICVEDKEFRVLASELQEAIEMSKSGDSL